MYSVVFILYFLSYVTDTNVIQLPKIFNLTDEYSCPLGHMYCKLSVTLRPQDKNNPPDIWKTIEKVNEKDLLKFRRDIIYRTVCVETKVLPEEYNEYRNIGLIGSVDYHNCFEIVSKERLSNYDIYLGLGIALYLTCMLYCNIRINKSGYTKDKNDNYAKYMEVFSVSNAWKELTNKNKGDDFQKLLSIQGLRTLTITVVILAHHLLVLLITFSTNPEYVEKYISNPYTGFIVKSFGVVVQVFFIISAWLLAVHLHTIVERNGKITFMDVLKIAFNRYCRLLPQTILYMLLNSASIWTTQISRLLYRYVITLEQNRCYHGWWRNMLFIQNWSCFGGDICGPGTWYLAVDTQLFLMVTLLFYISHKFKIHMKYLLGGATIFAVSYQVYTVMTTTFHGLLQFSPRMMPPENAFASPEFIYSYLNTTSNLSTYVIGFAFGSIYIKNKNKDIFNNTMKKILWFCGFFGLPLLSVMCYSHSLPRIIEAIMTVSVRPLFGMGFAIGILGMATGTGGYIKQFLETKPLMILGNVAFNVYMFHFALLVSSIVRDTQLRHLSNFYFWTTLVIEIVLSFIVGITMYIILEYPCTRLQKMFLPKVELNKRQSKEKTN